MKIPPARSSKTEAPDIAQLAALRARIELGQTFLRVPDITDDQFTLGLNTLARITREYLALVFAYQVAEPKTSIIEQQRIYEDRLAKGWTMQPSERTSQEQIDETFERLLREYEVLCDCAAGEEDTCQRLAEQRRLLISMRNVQSRKRRTVA